MALQVNATMYFVDYKVIDDIHVELHFTCDNPGPSEETDYYIIVTENELATMVSGNDFGVITVDKLQKKYRAKAVSIILDKFIGQKIVV